MFENIKILDLLVQVQIVLKVLTLVNMMLNPPPSVKVVY
jgi:hypothetical protein